MTSVSLGVGPFMKSPALGSRLGGRGTVPQGGVKSHDMRPESPGRGCGPAARNVGWTVGDPVFAVSAALPVEKSYST